MTVMPAASSADSPADRFIQQILPPWLKQASPADIQALRARFAACKDSRERLHQARRNLVPPDNFASSLLHRALRWQLGLTLDLHQAQWREIRRRFVVPPTGQLPTDEIITLRTPALQHLMQNFPEGVSYYVGSALVGPSPDEALLSDRLVEVAQLCREVDAGASYQGLLHRVFNVATHGQLAAEKRNALAMAAEIAALKGQLSQDDLQAVRRLVDNAAQNLPPDRLAQALLLRVLDQPVDGALAVELRDRQEQLTGVLVYLPDAAGQPLHRHASWQAAGAALAIALKAPAYRNSFIGLIALRERPAFLALLGIRLSDDNPDLAVQGRLPAEDIFVSLAVQQVARIKDDARVLLVPTAEADRAASEVRTRALEGAGMDLLNLAGLFVPVVGELLFGQMLVQTLGDVYEGAQDWSLGHQHEAMGHMLSVAETLALTALTVGTVAVVSTGFVRGEFVEQLEPVQLDSGSQRLWSSDLTPYRMLPEPENGQLQENGLYGDGQRHWWRHEGVSHQAWQPDEQGPWRLRHRERANAYGPELAHNGERAWRLRGERPLEWQGEGYLLARLWPAAEGLDAQRVEQILRIAGCDQDRLRGLLVENRPLPVALRDTLERFAVSERIDRFLASLTSGEDAHPDPRWLAWCREQLGVLARDDTELRMALLQRPAQWRTRLLEHFSRQYLSHDALLPLLQRDFPGLPAAYALDVLNSTSRQSRLRMLDEARLPLAVAEHARSALQDARLTRMLEGIYLEGSPSTDTLELVSALLRRRPDWPHALELETAVDAPQGLFEALVAMLGPAEAERLGWSGGQGAERLRHAVQAGLPATRRELLPLVGMREIRPRFNAGQRLADGRVGYPLSGRGIIGAIMQRTLRNRVRVLYPGFDEDQVTRYIDALHTLSDTPLSDLLHQEQSYRRFDQALETWQADLPRSMERNRRRYLCEALRRSWRMQGDLVIDPETGTPGMNLDLSGVEVEQLPRIPHGTDFGHIHQLNLSGMALEQMPEDFLGCFPRVYSLNLNGNHLDTLPSGLSELRDLRVLRLRRNRIHMTAPAAQMVRGLRHLQTLDLSYNPLGLIGLHFGPRSPLVELNLRRCQLQTLPAGLEWCGFLETADLRDNQLASLPQVILEAPAALRRTMLLDGNPLPPGVRRILALPAPSPVPAGPGWSREQWLMTSDAPERERRAGLWDQVRAEPGGDEFFDILDRMTESSDFELVRAQLQSRVSAVLAAVHESSDLRSEVFNLAASPRTCADSVASSFSTLEVRVLMARALQNETPGQGQRVRLDLARRLFRLEQVEQFARQDIAARLGAGQRVDEVEVSLAYRTGLAEVLELPGQPRGMIFEALAEVTEDNLTAAREAVQRAEATDALALYISQRDFWREFVRRTYRRRLEAAEGPFWQRLDALAALQESLSEGVYLERMNQLSAERQMALDAVFLELTRQALTAQSTTTV